MAVSGKTTAQKQSYTYRLGYNNTKVCKKTFMATFDIGEGVLKGVNNRRDKITGIIRQTMRGKRKLNNNKISFI